MDFFHKLNQRLAEIAKPEKLNESVGSTSGFLEGQKTDEGVVDTLKKGMATVGAKAKGLKANVTKNPADRQSAADAHEKARQLYNKGYENQPYIYKQSGNPDAADHEGSRDMHLLLKKQGMEEGSTGDYSAKKARAGKDIGKPGKMFSKIAKSAGERYGSKERGEKVAGAVLAKLRKGTKEAIDPSLEESDMEESALQAYLGKKKYGEAGMKALQKAGREGASKETMAKIRAKHDKMDEEMADEGNAFTAKLKATPKGGKFKLGDKEFTDTSNLEEKKGSKPDFLDLDKDGNRKETMKKAAKDAKKSRSSGTAFDPEVAKGMFSGEKGKTKTGHEVKDTGYSRRYTKTLSDEPETDDDKSDAPRVKGRPKGTKRAIGAKGPSGKSKLLKKDAIKEMDIALIDKGEYDREGEMAKQQMHTIMRAAKNLHGMLGDDDNLPEWVQKKITLAANYIDSVSDYMTSQRAEAGTEEPIAEKAVSQQQQKFMGMVHAMQKGDKIKGASPELKKVAKSMKPKDVKDFAATKHKGLPKKVEKEEADESAEAPKATKSKGGFEFGKGIYESMDNKFKQALTEGMNISVNMNTGPDGQPSKNITVSADGDDAEALAALLKMAGIGHKEETCPGCGKSECGCEESLDENSPDWPTNTETSDDALQYSGGLNGPKSTGQTTVPVIASQLRRQVSMEESVELERSLFKLYQNYKTQ